MGKFACGIFIYEIALRRRSVADVIANRQKFCAAVSVWRISGRVWSVLLGIQHKDSIHSRRNLSPDFVAIHVTIENQGRIIDWFDASVLIDHCTLLRNFVAP